jgi:hypothetical protein
MATGTSYRGAGETVVVIDTGWSAAWNTGHLVYQHDFLNGDADARVALTDPHGALVTASILQHAPDVGIIELKALPDDGGPSGIGAVEQALQWVVANATAYHVVAVNLSLAGGATTTDTATSLSDELAALAALRVTTVAAAGNAGDGGISQNVSAYAADHNEIAVSASTGTGQFPTWAQRSPGLTDLCADGTDIRLTDLAGHTMTVNGSSFAAPQVTAAVALAQEAAGNLRGSLLSQDEFLDLARATAHPLAEPGYAELSTEPMLALMDHIYGSYDHHHYAPSVLDMA